MRQYIGARYMPKFVGLWDNTTAYEALSVVDNGMGTSYVSNKPVPVGTPLTNADYWAVYGASSGAILDLQTRMTAAENDIDALETPHKIGIITDSYGTVESAWMTNIANSLALTLDAVAIGGRGYVRESGGGTFINSLASLDGTGTYDYLLVLGGQNDIGSSFNDIYSAVVAFITQAKTNLPKTKIVIVGPQSPLACYTSAGDSENLGICSDAISRACIDSGNVSYCNPANWLFNGPDSFADYLRSDNTHPSSAGYKMIETKLLSLLAGNGFDSSRINYYLDPVNVSTPVVDNLTAYISTDENSIHIEGTCTPISSPLAADTVHILFNIDPYLYLPFAISGERSKFVFYHRVGNKYTFAGLGYLASSGGDRQVRVVFTEAITGTLYFFADCYMNGRAATIVTP